MLSSLRRAPIGAGLLAATALLAAGCSTDEPAAGAGDGAIAVKAGDTACEVARDSTKAGATSFAVQNTGSQVTEFYVLNGDGKTIVSEVENIGPGLTRDMTVSLEPGVYLTRCRPGMTGDGISAQFEVTESGEQNPAAANPQLVAGSTQYVEWVRAEADALLTGTEAFAAAVKAKDVAQAKALYPGTRMHWERIEPVAESFGDLDPKMDARENDVEPGTPWTGWHKLEQELWVSGLQADAPKLADQLVADTRDLVARIGTLELTADRVTNGSKELLDEVATGKVTGEEERYSHTDLWDFAANVEGAEKGFEVVRPVAQEKDPALVTELDRQFTAIEAELAKYKAGDGYQLYTQLSQDQVRALTARVEALSEPLSKLTATILA